MIRNLQHMLGIISVNSYIVGILNVPQADDLHGAGSLNAQCTIRVSNIRNGIRRVTFRNERDNKDQPMAIVLVDIQVLSLEDINDRISKCKRDIKVGLVKLLSFNT